jgi:hypothetical protein
MLLISITEPETRVLGLTCSQLQKALFAYNIQRHSLACYSDIGLPHTLRH